MKEIRKRFQYAGTEAAWVVGGQIGVAAGSLLGIKVLTHILTPGEYGRYAIAITLATMVGISCFSPLGQGLMRYWTIARDSGRLDVFSTVANRYLTASMALAALLAVAAPALLTMTPWKGWWLLTGLGILLGGIAGVGTAHTFVITAIRKRKQVAAIHTAAALAKPLTGAAAAGLTIYCAEAVMAGYLLAAVVLYRLIEKVYATILSEATTATPHQAPTSARQAGKMGREILAFSWPFIVWGLFSWTHQFCDRWSLMAFHGAETVGAFAVIGQLALYPLIFGANFLTTYFTPIAYELAGDPKASGSLKPANRALFFMTGTYSAWAVGLIAAFALCHESIVRLVSNQRYMAYSHLLPWLTLAWALYYLGQMLSNFGLVVNRSRIYMKPAVVSAVLAAGLTFALAAASGPAGVVAGLAVAGTVYATWCLVICIHLFNHRGYAAAGGDTTG